MARIAAPPPKFTIPEWTISNQIKYGNAEGERAAAERLVEESKRVDEETRKTTFKTQRDVNKKIDQRLNDIKHWRKELDDKLDALKIETDGLLAYKVRINKAMDSLKEPLHIAQQCLINRQRRRGIDLVRDDPERELNKEVETLQGVLALLTRTHEQATEQIRLNRKATYNLENDLRDKDHAYAIDEHNSELKDNTPGIHFRDGYAKIDANSTSPDQWEDFSENNIMFAEKQRQSSQTLRSMIDGVLQTTANDLLKQKETTNLAFDRRIWETRDSKDKLQDHLLKVKAQITEMEDNIHRLQKALAENFAAPAMVCETRLQNRSFRPNVELCRDTVQYGLVEERQTLKESEAKLQMRLAQSEDSLKALTRRHLDLEDEIAVKANSLFIDETDCMGMRQSINIQTF